MPHASVYIDLLSCLVPFCVRAMTISLGPCHRSKSAMLCCCWCMRTVLLRLWVLRHVTKDIVIHTYIHTILPSRSFTTSFVFPSFPVPAKTIETHFRKKLTCGVIRSFNSFLILTTVINRLMCFSFIWLIDLLDWREHLRETIDL